ncbi:hypothetical protein L3Q82_007750 [Scortum barcoo]|uniref:Uncharacterized protein n=1 Tax=Scortum barcoo TaxID=214431 RepID=A0ACB8WP96_9TELE|nr:hypothetical protein L3Q82_007750 [Scortum barcoo]
MIQPFKTEDFQSLVKKGNSRLFLLRRLRSFGVQGPLLRTFYDSVVASAIFYGIVCWASSITDRDRRRMDRLDTLGSSFSERLLHPRCSEGETLMDVKELGINGLDDLVSLLSHSHPKDKQKVSTLLSQFPQNPYSMRSHPEIPHKTTSAQHTTPQPCHTVPHSSQASAPPTVGLCSDELVRFYPYCEQQRILQDTAGVQFTAMR